LTTLEIIKDSPFSVHVKRAVYAVLESGYYKPKDSGVAGKVYDVEDYILSNGVFVGGMSKEGFFICEDADDVIVSLWLSLMEDYDVDNPSPSKVFSKKMSELYQEATQHFP
jgi:hypothetical protein